MADELYELPQIIALALQTQRGELLKALGPTHAAELVKGMSEDTCVQIMNLIADLIDDRFKLKQQHQHAVELVEELRNVDATIREALGQFEGWKDS
jgi:hypothetical protein